MNKTYFPLDILFEEFLDEGVRDKGIFKAVFLAGGPGSGKDYVLSNMFQHLDTTHGRNTFTEINSDKALEYLMDKNKLDKKMPESEKHERDFVRGKAKSMTELRQRLAIHGRNGLVINGTGAHPEHVAELKKHLEDHGYETSMVMVHTSDDVSKKRNVERGQRGGRTVPEKVRKEKWEGVQNARPKHAEMFGKHYMEFDNSEDLRTAHPDIVNRKHDEMKQIFKKVSEFASKPTQNMHSNNWIASELSKRDRMKVGNKVQKVPNQNSEAHAKAEKEGLEHYGYGRYGKGGKVSHYTVGGQLMKGVNENFDKFLNEEVNISISADTPEEAIQTMRLLKGNDVDYKDNSPMSDKSPKNLLTLGRGFGVIEPQVSAGSFNVMPSLSTEAEEKKDQYLSDKKGNRRKFVLRQAAAREAHVRDGSVVRSKQGYHVKLKEDVSVLNESFLTEIDAGTEQGMSLSGHNKEFLGKDGKITSVQKKGLKELTGDTTTASIGAQKEDELKKKGISLATFRSKNPL